MIKVYTVNAFTSQGKGGNPAGVVLNADNLTTEHMQKIAAQVGFSETAFVMASSKANFKIRFFTPNKEVDLCGHATIASFHVLLEHKKIMPGVYNMETKAGVLAIHCDEEFLIFMQQNNPVFSNNISPEIIAACLSIEQEFLGLAQIVSTGLRKIFAPVKSLGALEKIQPNYNKILEISALENCLGIYAFTLDIENVTARCRNFAPIVGIFEDAATGTSAAALTCYLFKHKLIDASQNQFVIQQGYSINQPSEIITRIQTENENIAQIEVAGKAFITGEKEI